MGIDVGTSYAKSVIIDANQKIINKILKNVEGNPRKIGEELYKEALKGSKLSKKDIGYVVGTGTNMKSIMKRKQKYINEELPEITCIAKGIHELLPTVRTAIDVGALSNKAIKIGEDGSVKDYALNERCASGSGFFLETAMKALELTYEELSNDPFNVPKDNEITITSQCSIFGESEVIYLKNEDFDPIAIAAGINNSVAGRMLSIIKRVGIELDVIVTGGVAKNRHLLKKFEERLDGIKLKKIGNPQFIGAFGAALFAMNKVNGGK
ncbi:MAG: acyl-CoA dehydratase activase [Candidatus Helarchaeota archaeon]